MFRADHSTALADANGAGKNGYTDGEPGVQAATVATADAFNAFQEEIANTIEGFGGTLSKPSQNQMYTRLAAAITGAKPIGVRCELIGSGVAHGDQFVPSIMGGDTGSFSVDIVNDKIILPTYGLYLVSAHALITCASTANPLTFGINMRVGGGSTTNNTAVALATRWSATNTHKIAVSAVQLVSHTTGDKDADFLFEGTGSTGTIALSEGFAHIVRLKNYE